jgi:hypothetical protein
MEAKIENGTLMVEWYRRGGVPVFDQADCEGDRTLVGLVKVIAKLQERVDELERRLAVS